MIHPVPPPYRLKNLDALRGFATVWMTINHFTWDLISFGWAQIDFLNDPVWVWQRVCFLSIFMFCVGWSQAIRKNKPEHSYLQSVTNGGFWRRWSQVAVCAVLVSLISYLYPVTKERWIFFGVLHGIAVVLLILHLLKPWLDKQTFAPYILLGLTALCLWLFAMPPVVFNSAPLNIIGLISQKPATDDFVPLLPWIAPAFVGYAYGLTRKATLVSGSWWIVDKLAILGRWSLSYYMVHQPLIIGVMMVVFMWTKK